MKLPNLQNLQARHRTLLFVVGFASFFVAHMLAFTPVGALTNAEIVTTRVGENIAFAGAFLVMALYALRTGCRRLSSGAAITALSVLLFTTLVSTVALLMDVQLSLAINVLCHASNGIVAAFLFLYWISQAVRLDDASFKYGIFAGGLLGCFIIMFCDFYPSDMENRFVTILCLVTCFASVVCLGSGRQTEFSPSLTLQASKGPFMASLKALLVPVVLTGIVGLACQFVWTTLRVDSITFMYESVGHAFGVALLVLFATYPGAKPLNMERPFRYIAPVSLLCAGALMVVSGTARNLFMAVASAGFGACSLMLISLCCSVGKRQSVSVIALYALTSFIYDTLSTFGYVLGTVPFGTDTAFVYLLVGLLIAGITGGVWLVSVKADRDTLGSAWTETASSTLQSSSGTDGLLGRYQISDILAREYGLTPREEEILRLVLLGRDAPTAAEELCLSTNTVKTHVKRIYAKLGVHSRQDLATLVERYEHHTEWKIQ